MLVRAVIALLLMLTVATGGFFHAVIPHAHGHTHAASGVDATWQSLHTALRNEEKKTIFSALSAFTLFVVALLSAQIFAGVAAVSLPLVPIGVSQNLFEALRKGNLPYRKFT